VPAPPANTPQGAVWQNVKAGQVVDDWINAASAAYGTYWGDLLKLNPTDAQGRGLATNVSKSTDPRKRVFLYDTAYRAR
jgi:hypothetical protein